MSRYLILLGVAWTASLATGQNYAISWRRDPAAAVNEAQQKRLPLLVYVHATERDEAGRIDRDQKRALRDPAVLKKMKYFIPLQLSRAQHRDQLAEFGFSPTASMEMRFIAPDGQRLETVDAGAVSQPDALSRKMSLAWEAWGRRIFETEVKPVFDKKTATVAELRDGLKKIADFNVRSADRAVLDLLTREKLDAQVRPQVYETLARLSTKPAIDKLLEPARSGDAVAAQALDKCTPAGAELLLPQLKPEAAPFDYTVYKTLTKICKVPQPKPERWFENAPLVQKQEEVERVTRLVQASAAQWKADNE